MRTVPPERIDQIPPLTPQAPIASTTTQISWSTRSRVVVSAYPTRHINSIFSTKVHWYQTTSARPGNIESAAKREESEIQTIKSNVVTLSGVSGSDFFSREIIHEKQVTIAIM